MNISKEQINDTLRRGECVFSFKKNSGEIREAVGTLHPRFLPLQEEGTSAKKPPNENVVTYWDIEADGWRAFRIDQLVDAPKLTMRIDP